jgi:hypothetical protein
MIVDDSNLLIAITTFKKVQQMSSVDISAKKQELT